VQKDGEKESRTIIDQVKDAASSAFRRSQDINLEMQKHQPADEGEFVDLEAKESDARKKLKVGQCRGRYGGEERQPLLAWNCFWWWRCSSAQQLLCSSQAEFMKKQDEKTDSAGGSPLQH
jgi:hypothetical protein